MSGFPDPAPSSDLVRIGPLAFRPMTAAAARALIAAYIAGKAEARLCIAFGNAHTVNLAAADAAYAETLRQCLLLNDGIGVDLAARLLTGRPFPDNLDGTDFVPALLANAPASWRVGLLGGRRGIAERARDALTRLAPRHHYTVIGHGYLDADERRRRLAGDGAQGFDLVLIAMGQPLQERVMVGEMHGTATVTMGVGALFDFLAGAVPRAPLSWRRLRLEWLFRLLQEPRRLFGRYALGIPLFLFRVLLWRWQAPPP